MDQRLLDATCRMDVAMSKTLTIAIDFDDTFTADQTLWSAFIKCAQAQGHKVVCVTARRFDAESKAEMYDVLPEHVPVYFTSLGSKLAYMEKQGVKVDIWCDDNPKALVHGH